MSRRDGVPTVFRDGVPQPGSAFPFPLGNGTPGTPSNRGESGTPLADWEHRSGTPSNRGSAKQPVPNVRGNSGDPNRGSWCTPKWLAQAVGPFSLDPFSNPRSHIVSNAACWLERGDDGFGDGSPGSFFRSGHGLSVATAESLVWFQPPYSFVLRAFRHYAHTRWCALLRFDPRTEWFDAVFDTAELVAVIRRDPDGKPFNFEPPPGVTASSNSFPHALFFRRADDATDEALRHCAAWRKRPT